jgi:hypothetical protein
MNIVKEWDLNPVRKGVTGQLLIKKVWWWLVNKADTSNLEKLYVCCV